MKVIGIDPGLASTGWAVLNQKEKNSDNFEMAGSGLIKTKAGLEISRRLEIIHDDLFAVIKKYQPEEMAVEDVFFAKNVKTAIKVAQAVGVIKYTGIEAGLDVFSYTPLNIKTAITGYGRAEKDQVQFMVKKIIKSDQEIKPDHAVDAAAAALTHLFTSKELKV
jgi:crossover junction endodeoxyribonuclease RuvC